MNLLSVHYILIKCKKTFRIRKRRWVTKYLTNSYRTYCYAHYEYFYVITSFEIHFLYTSNTQHCDFKFEHILLWVNASSNYMRIISFCWSSLYFELEQFLMTQKKIRIDTNQNFPNKKDLTFYQKMLSTMIFAGDINEFIPHTSFIKTIILKLL